MRSRGDRRERGGKSGIRPVLLAAGLGLLWFAEFQDNAFAGDAPNWAMAAALGSRLTADVVGALVVISLLRLVLMLARLIFVRWRLQRQLEVR